MRFNANQFIIFTFLLLLALPLWGQRGGQLENPNTPTYLQDTFPILDSLPFARVPDTVRITYILAQNPNQEFEFSDSLLNNDFQQYDILRRQHLPFVNLGNPGSANRSLVYDLPEKRGFDIGLHQYDIYNRKASEMPFFTLAPAFTNTAYTQGNDQNDAKVEVEFGRKFDGGTNMSLFYQRLVHSLEDDELPLNQNAFYKYQAARHTSAGLGIWYNDKKGRYDAFLTFVYNQNKAVNHGGIISSPATDTLIQSGNNIQDTSIPVYQSGETAETEHQKNTLLFTHHYRLGGGVDSLGKARRSFTLSHKAKLESAKYKFSETAPNANFYKLFYTDSRGLRQYMEVQTLENHFLVNTFQERDGRRQLKSQRDLLQIGLLHRYNNIYQEPTDSLVQNLFLTGKLNFTPNNRLQIQTYAHLGLWNQAGDYQIKGDFYFDFQKLGKLRLYAQQQLYEPSLLQTRSFISERTVWNNQWKKTLETKIGGTWGRPEWQLKVTANYILSDNLVYFDTLGSPQQFDNPFSIGQLVVEKNFQLWQLHLDNKIIFQQNSTNEVLRMPSVVTKNSLYFEGFLFKKSMFARTGFDLWATSSYQADTYQAAIGQFHLQDNETVQFYPAVDFFFSFKVDRFRTYIKMENLTSLLTTDIFEQTPNYPHKEIYFRFGVRWLFLDAALPPSREDMKGEQSRPR